MPHLRRAVVFFLVSGALAAGVAGCGSREPSDEEKVRETLSGLAAATAAKDYGRLCKNIFAEELLRGISEIGLSCEVAMRNSLAEVKSPRLTVGRVEVKAKEATAEVRTSAEGQAPSRDTVRLVKAEDGGWRVSSLADAEGPQTAPEPTPEG